MSLIAKLFQGSKDNVVVEEQQYANPEGGSSGSSVLAFIVRVAKQPAIAVGQYISSLPEKIYGGSAPISMENTLNLGFIVNAPQKCDQSQHTHYTLHSNVDYRR